ncbi:hypothetical protein ATG66_0228 [Vibrio sp. ES.051]|uniref:hypothetical protein n=1 Tax=Vibrio sp. ES.051 TaxID=1761909 RepID=UPI000BF903B6|nr:hypothetical protein [Vibrio sp. ES.051]PFG57734.1 hypothetical protein ATG66_0228 [Vibrio sp. ES.051]
MIRLPAFSFSISESGGRESSTKWPAAIRFPLVPAGPEFSIENALPKWPTVTIFTIDLSQLLKTRARVIH